MTYFWRLRVAIQIRDLTQAQEHLIKCREVLPQLEELLRRWETVLDHLVQDNRPIADELRELDTDTDDQLQSKWEKPQWSWKSASIVAIFPLIIDYVIAIAVTVLFDLPSLIVENIFTGVILWWWWKYHRKQVLYSEPFAVWFFTGARICADICKHSRGFHIYLAFSIINNALYLLSWTVHSRYEPGKNFFGWYSHEATIYPIWYLIRLVLAAPLMEEIIFRDTLFSFFKKKWKRVPAYILISVLFILIHTEHIINRDVNAIIILSVLSIISTWFYEKHRHLFAAILIHSLNNGFAVLQQMTIWYLIYSKVQ